MQQVMNGTTLPPRVAPGDVRVTGIIRLPTDLTDNLDAPADVMYEGQGDIIATAAFYHQYTSSVGNFEGISFQLKDGAAGLPAFEAQVNRLGGGNAQIELGDDNVTAAAFAQRSTSFEALALLVFAVIVGLALLVVVGQSLVRQVRLVTADFPALRALGASPRQLAVAALAPGALVAVAGMTLAVPVAYRALGVHADRAGAPGGGLAGTLVRRRGRARRGRGARAAARGAGGARRTAGGTGGRPRVGGPSPPTGG